MEREFGWETAAARQESLGNEPWRVEPYGIELVPPHEQRGTLVGLFWLWFAANIGMLGVVYGAILVAFGLNLVQGVLAVLAGGLSFALVGFLGVGGVRGHAPMLTLSRAIFGVYGNVVPSFVSWLSLVGWEAVAVITGTFALEALVHLLLPSLGSIVAALLALGAELGLSIAFALLGHATLMVVQEKVSYLFGALTFIILILLFPVAGLHRLATSPPAPWGSAFLPALTVIVAGSGLSWANTAADYSRYLPGTTPPGPVVAATTLGGGLPLAFLALAGMAVSAAHPTLAQAANPIAALGALLPSWASIPYFLTAAAGMVAQADLGLYSSGLNLQALFVPIRRHRAVVVDGALITLATLYVVLVARSFLAPFESFVLLLGVGIASWCGVFLADMLLVAPGRGYPPSSLYRPVTTSLVRHGVGWAALLAWGVGTCVGLLFTSSPYVVGPLAHGPFGGAGFGVLFALLSGALGYGAFALWYRGERRPGSEVRGPGAPPAARDSVTT